MKLDRFGWAQMSSAMKDRLTLDWCDVLSPYRLEEVKVACAAIMARRPKDATNEKQVEVEIKSARAKAFKFYTEAPDTYIPCENPITPEAHAKLMEEFGSPRGKVKTFTGMDFRTLEEGFGKPREIE